jgi:hypothetical protein
VTDFDDRLRTGITALAERAEPKAKPDDVIAVLGRGSRRSPKIGLRVAVAAAVVLVVVVGVALVRRDEHQPTVDVGPASTDEPQPQWHPTSLSPGWHALPEGPLGALSPRAMVWTGSELVVWRGEGPGKVDRAAAFSPTTNQWTELPADPLDTRYLSGVGAGGAWTGEEALFWAPEGVVAWNPADATWRSAASPPHAHERDGVWTGTDVIFWADGLAYNPFDDSWRQIARPSEFLVATVNDDADGLLWTGGQVVVVGGLSGAYDPATDTWREFGAPLAIESGSPGVAWDGFTATVVEIDGRITTFDASPSSAAVLDLVAGRWSEVPELTPPIDPAGQLEAAPLADGSVVFVAANGTIHRSAEGQPFGYPTPTLGPLVSAGVAVFSYGGLGARDLSLWLFVPPPASNAPA